MTVSLLRPEQWNGCALALRGGGELYIFVIR